MSAFKHKSNGEVVIPVPGGAYEARLRESDDYSEITTEGSLNRAVGAETETPVEALTAEPESTKQTPPPASKKSR